MSDASKPFNFGSFVPGFDFLKNLAAGSAGSTAVPGMQGLANWIAPTLSVEEVDKRIKELKTVQFWLEQNLTALKATIQALEVQKMTLSTLKGMNLRMEDLANSFTRAATAASAATVSTPAPPPPAPKARPEPEPEPEEEEEEAEEAEVEAAPAAKPAKSKASAAPSAGVVDPLQWWSALTQQFEQIASGAMRDAGNLKLPTTLQSTVDKVADAARKAVTAPGKKTASAKKKAPAKPAGKRATATAKRAGSGRR
jgi:hypothetical protein